MNKHLKYANYVIRHKWFVFQAGLKTGAPLWRLVIHDWSKLTPSEWGPYVEYFYGNPNQDSFDKAWLHHQHLNPHHHQHWLLKEDDGGGVKALMMPPHFTREMVADWMGAGRAITGKWETASWYRKNKDKMVLHPTTRFLVERLLDDC